MRIVVGRMRTRMAGCGLGMSSLSGLRGGAGIFFMSSAAVDAGLLGSVGVAINDASGLPHTPVSSVAGLVTPFWLPVLFIGSNDLKTVDAGANAVSGGAERDGGSGPKNMPR